MKILTAFALGMSVAVGSMTGVSAAEPVVSSRQAVCDQNRPR